MTFLTTPVAYFKKGSPLNSYAYAVFKVKPTSRFLTKIVANVFYNLIPIMLDVTGCRFLKT
jgi:hypothetical protein